MEIRVTGIWATPSTLHLRVMTVGKNGRWSQFHNVHIPMSEVPSEVAALIWLSAENDRETSAVDQATLF